MLSPCKLPDDSTGVCGHPVCNSQRKLKWGRNQGAANMITDRQMKTNDALWTNDGDSSRMLCVVCCVVHRTEGNTLTSVGAGGGRGEEQRCSFRLSAHQYNDFLRINITYNLFAVILCQRDTWLRVNMFAKENVFIFSRKISLVPETWHGKQYKNVLSRRRFL
jgi:hypothetical protein